MDKVSGLAGTLIAVTCWITVQVLQKARDALNARGAKTIRSLGRVFRNFDSYNGDKKLDRDEFFIGLKEIGVSLTKTESDVIILYEISNDSQKIRL